MVAAVLLTACTAGKDRPTESNRSQANIAASFDRSKYEIYRIYSDRLRVRPGLAGRTVFRFTVNTYGQVVRCEVLESTLDDSEVENAVIRVISGMDFGSVWPPGDVTVTYPIQFLPTTPKEPGPP